MEIVAGIVGAVCIAIIAICLVDLITKGRMIWIIIL